MGVLHRRNFILSALAAGPVWAHAARAADADSSELSTFASGLRFPEGPMALADGSALVCEIGAGRVTRVRANGKHEIVGETGGSPAGCAVGPDGAYYVGGLECKEVAGGKLICAGRAADYSGGRIERIDPKTGKVQVLYSEVNGNKLGAPDDLVFDDHGGFWFTDAGTRNERSRDYAGLYYAKADGSFIKEVVFRMTSINGIGLAPDGKTVYVTFPEERLIAAFPITGEGTVDRGPGYKPGRPIATFAPGTIIDSLKVEADETICVAVPVGAPGGVYRFKPNGESLGVVPYSGGGITNLAFGGKDLRTAFLTDSLSGLLLKTKWPAAGLKLNYQTV